jgi:hypothetical protein
MKNIFEIEVVEKIYLGIWLLLAQRGEEHCGNCNLRINCNI